MKTIEKEISKIASKIKHNDANHCNCYRFKYDDFKFAKSLKNHIKKNNIGFCKDDKVTRPICYVEKQSLSSATAYKDVINHNILVLDFRTKAEIRQYRIKKWKKILGFKVV